MRALALLLLATPLWGQVTDSLALRLRRENDSLRQRIHVLDVRLTETTYAANHWAGEALYYEGRVNWLTHRPDRCAAPPDSSL